MENNNENISLYDILETKDVNGIEKSLAFILSRLGVNVDVYVTEKEIYDGRLMVQVRSTDFQTTPTIFKSLHIEGDGFTLQDPDKENILHLNLRLSYRYELFDGGTNGANIGVCQYIIFKSTRRVLCDGLKISDY